MNKNAKIFVAGHNGMVGSAMIRLLQQQGYHNYITRNRKELDLTQQPQVTEFFAAERPEYVFLAAATVGGIYANNTYPADFIYNNLAIQNNVIHAAYQHQVKRLLFLGSSCIYPKNAPQPLQEDYLLTGVLEPTNEPYAIAKIAGIKMCESYNRQYGTDFRSIMPTNLYGQGDNFHPVNSHVIAALIRRFHEAKISNQPTVQVWGSGKPRREFLYIDDMAAACLHLMNLSKSRWQQVVKPMNSHLNAGSGVDISISELAQLIKQVIGFSGDIVFDSTKPDGTMQKLMDSSKLNVLGWDAHIDIRHGLEKTYQWFLKTNLDEVK